MSKVHQLDVLMSKDFDSSAGVGPWVPLPDVIALGIGPYSRRFQDLRKLYFPQGFDVENRIERGSDGITRSWYRKVRTAYPLPSKPETHFDRQELRKRSDTRADRAAWFEKTFHVTPGRKPADPKPEPEPEWSLTP